MSLVSRLLSASLSARSRGGFSPSQRLHRACRAAGGGAIAAAAIAAAVVASPTEAHAQAASVDGRGIAGGALLGGELVTGIMGAAGVRPWWPYVAFGLAGAAAGAAGGFGVEEATRGNPATGVGSVPEAPIAMLAGGIVLLIPAIVLSVNATSQPPEGLVVPDGSDPSRREPAPTPPQEGAPTEGAPPAPGSTPAAPAPAPQAASRASRRTAPVLSSGVFGWNGGWVPGIPLIGVKQLYSQREVQRFGVDPGVEVRVPVFEARF
jgi:hypothetical protein